MRPLDWLHEAGIMVSVINGTLVMLSIVNEAVDEQLNISVTVTTYVPVSTSAKSSVVIPFDQRKVYASKGVTCRLTEPFAFVQDVIFVTSADIEKLILLLRISKVSATSHPLGAVTIREYMPEDKSLMSSVV